MQTDTITVEVLNDFWTYFQAIATGVGALITALTIALVLWQTVLTRRSVRATEASVLATESALRLARDEYDRNTVLIKDSQRAKIDAEMPRLTTVVSRHATQAWRMDVEGEDGELKVGKSVLMMPRDADVPIAVGVRVLVTNDGPRQARFEVYQPRNPSALVGEMVVDNGSSKEVWVRRVESLARWIEIAQIYDAPGGDASLGEATVFEFNYIYPGDLGAIEHQRVLQGGSIVARVPGTPGDWTLASFEAGRYGGLSTVAQPYWRTYYASRSENREL